MQVRRLAVMAVVAALGGCADRGGDPPWPALASWWPGASSAAATSDPDAAGQQAARSIWGVVPSAPPRKAELRPQLISGAAVAVSADTLLASCAAVQGKAKVGLVRHNKYRLARVAADDTGQICRLTVMDGPLTPVAGYRSFADLRVGEPVVALTSRTSAEVTAAPGWLVGKGSPSDPFLETTVQVPAGTSGVVLVDGFGNLVGLGSAGPVADGLLLTVPIGTAAPPALANADLGGADVLLASLTPSPRAQPGQAPRVLLVSDNDRNGGDRAPRDSRRATADTDGADRAPGAGGTASADDRGGTPSSGSPGNDAGSSGGGSGAESRGSGEAGSPAGAASSPSASSGNESPAGDPGSAAGGDPPGGADRPGQAADDGGRAGGGATQGARDDRRGGGRGVGGGRGDDNGAGDGPRGRGGADRGRGRGRDGRDGGEDG